MGPAEREREAQAAQTARAAAERVRREYQDRERAQQQERAVEERVRSMMCSKLSTAQKKELLAGVDWSSLSWPQRMEAITALLARRRPPARD